MNGVFFEICQNLRDDIMKCFDCGADLAAGIRLCGNCGREIRNRNGNSNRNGSRREPSGGSRQTFPIAEALTALEAWKAAKQNRHTKRQQTQRITAGIAMLLSASFCGSQIGMTRFTLGADPAPAVIAEFIFVAATVILLSSLRRCVLFPSEREYYTLPGAHAATGEHQCVFCGGRGVHKKTPYKTNSTVADCTKCRANLWYN